jgi:hypothetical protein
MTDWRIDPRAIEQHEQQHAERNRLAVQRGLQHARRDKHQDGTTEPGQRLPDLDPKSGEPHSAKAAHDS